MPDPTPAKDQLLTLALPETLAKRLQLAASKAHRSPAEVVLEILHRNLPRIEDPNKKRVPYT